MHVNHSFMATVQNTIESAFYFKQKKHIRIVIPHEAMHDACCKKTKKNISQSCVLLDII